jgi:hypothetical protein
VPLHETRQDRPPATFLQDANVDPLIRQLTLGHKPSSPSAGALGMTSVYTHTRPPTQFHEIERALRLWPRSLLIALEWVQGGAACRQGYLDPTLSPIA